MKISWLFLFITVISFLVFIKYFYANTSRNAANLNPIPVLSKQTESIQNEILTYSGIDSVLNTIQQIPFEELDKEYLVFSGYDRWPGKSKMKHRIFYMITGNDSLKYLVSKFKVGDFLPKDSIHYRNSDQQDENYIQYLCIDTCVLHRFLDLILLVRENGYTDAFSINDGYRYPSFNKRTGGVFFSQHMFGNAIDLAVGDINNDGIIYNTGTIDEDKDKRIVIGFLEDSIIRNSGGVGRYPGSNVVHFDTRGFKKRWDNQ